MYAALMGKQGSETLIGRGQSRAQRLQCDCVGQTVKFQQIAQAAYHRADTEAKRIVDHQFDPQRIALHPESLGDFRDANDILWMVETSEDGPLWIADPDLLLGCDPDLGETDEIFRLDIDEAAPIPFHVMRAPPLRAGADDGQYRWGD